MISHFIHCAIVFAVFAFLFLVLYCYNKIRRNSASFNSTCGKGKSEANAATATTDGANLKNSMTSSQSSNGSQAVNAIEATAV